VRSAQGVDLGQESAEVVSVGRPDRDQKGYGCHNDSGEELQESAHHGRTCRSFEGAAKEFGLFEVLRLVAPKSDCEVLKRRPEVADPISAPIKK
jgi:hypothetical protein